MSIRLASTIIFLTGLFNTYFADLVDVDKCKDIAFPYQVDISNCTLQPCSLIRGSDIIVKVDFFAPYYIDDFSPKITAFVAGASVNYPVTVQKDGCAFVENTQCPFEPEEYVSYTFIMNVLKLFPKISLGIQLTLTDQNNDDFICFYVDCIVVDEV